jgi:hypothetical protein
MLTGPPALHERGEAHAGSDPAEASRPGEAQGDPREWVARLDRVLLEEPRDPEWSAKAEKQLSTALRKDVLGSAEVLETRCGSTFCRIGLRYEARGGKHTVQRVFDLLPWDGEGVFNGTTGKNGRHLLSVYFAREGAKLPSATR